MSPHGSLRAACHSAARRAGTGTEQTSRQIVEGLGVGAFTYDSSPVAKAGRRLGLGLEDGVASCMQPLRHLAAALRDTGGRGQVRWRELLGP